MHETLWLRVGYGVPVYLLAPAVVAVSSATEAVLFGAGWQRALLVAGAAAGVAGAIRYAHVYPRTAAARRSRASA